MLTVQTGEHATTALARASVFKATMGKTAVSAMPSHVDCEPWAAHGTVADAHWCQKACQVCGLLVW